MGFMLFKVIFGRGVYMGAMVNSEPIFLKFGAIFKGFMIVKLFSGRTFVWGLGEIMDLS